MCCDVGGLRQPFAHVACRADMPFLKKLADITVSGRHVADMAATFPAKLVITYLEIPTLSLLGGDVVRFWRETGSFRTPPR